MADRTFTTLIQFSKMLEPYIKKAIMAAARRISYQLRIIIEEQYYNDPDFYPNIYRRTNTFLDSATYELLGFNLAEIGIDTDSMHYYNNFDPDKVVEYASMSQHGSELYQTSAEPFWEVFLRWADENVIKILKEELSNQGIKLV